MCIFVRFGLVDLPCLPCFPFFLPHTGVHVPSAEKSGHDQFEESTEEVGIRFFQLLVSYNASNHGRSNP